MGKLVFPLTILLLATLIHSGSGQEAEKKKEPLKCYQCNSYEDALCADPFFHDELGQDGEQLAKSGDDFLDECPSDGKDYKFCRKIYQNVRGDERVIAAVDGSRMPRAGRATQQFWKSTTQKSALAKGTVATLPPRAPSL